MNLAGWDLGNKYLSYWARTGLWYNDKIRHHWIWLIISFVGGVLGALAVQWLSS